MSVIQTMNMTKTLMMTGTKVSDSKVLILLINFKTIGQNSQATKTRLYSKTYCDLEMYVNNR